MQISYRVVRSTGHDEEAVVTVAKLPCPSHLQLWESHGKSQTTLPACIATPAYSCKMFYRHPQFAVFACQLPQEPDHIVMLAPTRSDLVPELFSTPGQKTIKGCLQFSHLSNDLTRMLRHALVIISHLQRHQPPFSQHVSNRLELYAQAIQHIESLIGIQRWIGRSQLVLHHLSREPRPVLPELSLLIVDVSREKRIRHACGLLVAIRHVLMSKFAASLETPAAKEDPAPATSNGSTRREEGAFDTCSNDATAAGTPQSEMLLDTSLDLAYLPVPFVHLSQPLELHVDGLLQLRDAVFLHLDLHSTRDVSIGKNELLDGGAVRG